MPKIPKFISEKTPPGRTGGVPVSPEMAGMTGRAFEGLGNQIQKTADTINTLYEKEQLANDTIKAMQLEKSFDEKKLQILGSYQTRTDYDNFDKDLDNSLAQIQQELAPKNGSPRLNMAFQKGFNQFSIDLKSTIQKKKFDVMGKQGLIALDDIEEIDIKRWINAKTPEEREQIAKEYEMKGNTVVANFAVDPIQAHNKIASFRSRATQQAENESIATVMQLREVDPKKALSLLEDPTYKSDIPNIKREELKISCRSKIVANEKEETKRIEEEQNKIIESNDIKARADFHNNKLTWDDLQRRAMTSVVNEKISKETFNSLEALMRNGGENVKDNPYVVGKLALKVGMGVDVSKDLTGALQRGQMKDSTYIELNKSLGSKLASEAQRIVNQALEPTQFEKFNPDIKLRHSDATVELNKLIAGGMSPPEAASKVVGSYTAHVRRTMVGLPAPTYLSGEKNNPIDLDKAEEKTVMEFKGKKIDETTFKMEMQKIYDLRKMIEENERVIKAEQDIENLKKQVKR